MEITATPNAEDNKQQIMPTVLPGGTEIAGARLGDPTEKKKRTVRKKAKKKAGKKAGRKAKARKPAARRRKGGKKKKR
jgi:hypothetical protein